MARNKHRTLIRACIFVALFFIVAPILFQSVSAQTTTPVYTQQFLIIQQLQETITRLQAQIQELKAKLETSENELMEVTIEFQITKTLVRGARGDEVKKLQEFLKQFPDIYPKGFVTGYFGSLTEAAVRRFQEKNGIDPVGIVGPKTRAVLREIVAVPPPAAPSGTIPAEPATSAEPRGQTGTTTIPAVPAVPALPVGQATLSGSALTASSSSVSSVPVPSPAASDSSVPTASAAASPVSAPSASSNETVSLAISAVQVSSITGVSATIGWTTNIPADSQVEYGITSGYGSTTALDVTLGTAHSVPLDNLSGGITYYFRVKSKDVFGNTAFGAPQSFTTVSPPPAPALVISNIRTYSPYYEGGTIINNNAMVIEWDTNKSNVGIVEYGLTSSYGRTQRWNDESHHQITLWGLNVGTQYFFRITGDAISEGKTFTMPFPGTTIASLPVSSRSSSISPVLCDVRYDVGLLAGGIRFLIGGIADKAAAVTYTFATSSTMVQSVFTLTDSQNIVHQLALGVGKLQPSTQYYFQLAAADSGGNTTVFEPISFTTPSLAAARPFPGAYDIHPDSMTPSCSSHMTAAPSWLRHTFANLASLLESLTFMLQKIQAAF